MLTFSITMDYMDECERIVVVMMMIMSDVGIIDDYSQICIQALQFRLNLSVLLWEGLIVSNRVGHFIFEFYLNIF